MKSNEIKKLLEEGYLKIRVIFEIIGRPKEHIEQTIKAYIENIKTKETDIHVLSEDYEPAEELEGEDKEGLFGVMAEVEMLVPNIQKLTWLVINFSPASVEVLEPSELTLDQRTIGEWITDMLAKLHEIGMFQKSIASQNEGLIRNFNAMTRNAIILCLQDSEKDINYISKKIGMNNEHTEKFLNALVKEGKIKKEKNNYYLIK